MLPGAILAEVDRRLLDGAPASAVFRDLRLIELGIKPRTFALFAKGRRAWLRSKSGKLAPVTVRGSRVTGDRAARKAALIAQLLLADRSAGEVAAVLRRALVLVEAISADWSAPAPASERGAA